MKYEETLTLKSDKPIEAKLLKELGNHLQQRGIEVYIRDVDVDCLEMCQKLIIEKGPSYILSLEILQEAVLPKLDNMTELDAVTKVLSNYLQKLSPLEDLTIIDRYFFGPMKSTDIAGYLSTVRGIFSSVIPKIDSIRFITKPDYDKELYRDITQLLIGLSPKINTIHNTTDDFHDRFWIADKAKGLVVGTSLNGIGKRFALVDFMRDEDTATIVKELKRARLL